MTVRWSGQALRDLAGIYDYVAADNAEAAARVTDRILSVVDLLAGHPRLGRESAFRRRRELVIDSYIALYSLRRDEIVVEALRHGARRR